MPGPNNQYATYNPTGPSTSSTNPGPAEVTTVQQEVLTGGDGGVILGQSVNDYIGFYGLTLGIQQQASSVDLITQLVNLGLVASGTAVQNAGGSNSVINSTAATLTITAALHAGKTVTLNKASGQAITLPAATGTGNAYSFDIGTTITSVGTTITTGVTGASSDSFQGYALLEDSAAMTGYVATAGAGGSDVITLNGSTTGGFVGDRIVLRDITAGQWQVDFFVAKATGTAATPFSHT
jgi:hypothetical protein